MSDTPFSNGVWCRGHDKIWHFRKPTKTSVERAPVCHTITTSIWRKDVPAKPAELCEKCRVEWAKSFLNAEIEE